MSKGASPQHLRAAGEDASFSGAWGACWWGAEVCRQLGPTPSVYVCVTVCLQVCIWVHRCVCVCEHSCTNAHHQEKLGQVQLCRDLPLPPTTPPPQSQLRPACSSLQIPVTHPPAPTLSSGTAARGGWQTRGEGGGAGQQGEPTSGQPSLWHCTPNLQHPQSATQKRWHWGSSMGPFSDSLRSVGHTAQQVWKTGTGGLMVDPPAYLAPGIGGEAGQPSMGEARQHRIAGSPHGLWGSSSLSLPLPPVAGQPAQ